MTGTGGAAQGLAGRQPLLAIGAGVALLLSGAAGAKAEARKEVKTNRNANLPGDWQVLFDGTDLDRWRGYQEGPLPDGWRIEGDTLYFSGGRGDIMTRDRFGDFELTLEWKVAPGGNSGIFYRAVTGLPAIYEGAPEMQVLDDAGHADGADPLTSAGAAYGLYPAQRGVVRPAGEWNAVRLLVTGDRVEHWLNGQPVVRYTLNSPDWQARVAQSKFASWPHYGKAREGHIGLQDHGDPVWYRNILIRSLD